MPTAFRRKTKKGYDISFKKVPAFIDYHFCYSFYQRTKYFDYWQQQIL